MQVYGQLEKAQLENVAGNLSGTLAGLVWYDSVAAKAKVYSGGAIRTLVETDSTQTLTNKTLTGNILGSFTPNGVNTITVPATTGTMVTDTFAQTLSNKTITGGVFDVLNLTHQTTPAAPAAGRAQLYFKNDNLLYGQNSSGFEFPIGSGSGGGLDTFYSEQFVTTRAADFSSGNSSTFLGGGVLAGTLSNETAAPLSGTLSIKYVQAAGSLNDYVASPVVTVPLAARGVQVGIKFPYLYNGATGDIKVVVYDVTNAATTPILTSTLDLVEVANTTKFMQVSVFVPSNCTQIRYGFQVVVANSAKILYFDNVELSTNPFTYKNFTENQTLVYQVAQSAFQDRAGELRFPADLTTASFSGPLVLRIEDDAANTRTKFVAVRDCLVDISYNNQPTGAGTAIIRLNGTSVMANQAFTGTADLEVSVSGLKMVAGDFVTIAGGEAGNVANLAKLVINAQAQSEAVVSPQSGDDSYVLVDGTTTGASNGSTNTGCRSFGTNRENAGTDITYARSTVLGDTWTINRAGLYHFVYRDQSSVGHFQAVTRNSTQLTTSPNSYTASSTFVLAWSENTSNGYSECTGMAYLKVGDVIRAQSNTSGMRGDASYRSAFYIARVGYKGLSAAPVQQVATLKDVRASGTQAGSASGITTATRTLNTVEGDASIVTLSANQFTLAAGTYSIEAKAPGFKVDNHRCRIRNITDSTSPILGSSEYAGSGDTVTTSSIASGVITITASKTFELQHYTNTASANQGFGAAVVSGESEVYAIVKITKVR